METVTVISGDPGSKNFAISVIEGALVEGKVKIRLHGTTMLPEEARLFDLTKDIQIPLGNYRNVLRNLAREYGSPAAVCFERFQTRGILGKTIECISMMNAVPPLIFGKADVRVITAATWKNRINRFIDLKASYKEYKLTRVASLKRDHELDACLIGIYMIHKHFDVPDFQIFENDGNFHRFMEKFLESPDLELDWSKPNALRKKS